LIRQIRGVTISDHDRKNTDAERCAAVRQGVTILIAGDAPMFFVLFKLLGVFAFPSNVAILMGILGLLLLPTRFARAGRWLTFASVLVLAILGLSPLGNMLLFPLENRFPPWDATRGAPDGIIVLGGVVDASSPGNQIMLNESADDQQQDLAVTTEL
jgi:hypothetical protein